MWTWSLSLIQSYNIKCLFSLWFYFTMSWTFDLTFILVKCLTKWLCGFPKSSHTLLHLTRELRRPRSSWFHQCLYVLGRYSQTGTPPTPVERHQRGFEEPTAPHAFKSPARATEGQTLLTAIVQSSNVLWLPKPYDAWLKQVSSRSFLNLIIIIIIITIIVFCIFPNFVLFLTADDADDAEFYIWMVV